MKKTRKILFSFIIIASLVFLASSIAPAATAQQPTFGLEDTAKAASLKITDKTPAQFAGDIIGYALSFIGVVFFVLMIYGGLRWMTARGNSEIVEKSKNIIETAFIGIIIIFLAYTVTNFVINKLVQSGGAPATEAAQP